MAENPWDVDSVQVFWYLKCPECIFDSQEEDIFRLHAIENHPMSFTLFDEKLKEENENENEIKTENDDQNYYEDDYQGNGDNFDNQEDNFNENEQPENMFSASMHKEETDLVKQELSDEDSKIEYVSNKIKELEEEWLPEKSKKRPGRIPLKSKKVEFFEGLIFNFRIHPRKLK